MKDTHSTVFVVDDDSSVRDGLVDLISSVGMTAKPFTSAQEFLQHKRQNAPACLVLDVRLPGLSGLELAASIRPVGALNSDHLHHWAWGHSHVGSGHEGGCGGIPDQAVSGSGFARCNSSGAQNGRCGV